MKIAVSAMGPSMDSEVDPRFGRCQYFVIVDPDTMEAEVLNNSNANTAGGAGISAGQTIASKDATVLLTGNCGPNAFQTLAAANIAVITGVSGKVRDAIQKYKAGEYQSSTQANVADHFGKGGNPNMGTTGMFGGGGRGMGRGGGRGMGRGGGIGQ